VAPLCRDIPIKELKIILTGELSIVRRVQRGEGSALHAKDAASDKVLAMRPLGSAKRADVDETRALPFELKTLLGRVNWRGSSHASRRLAITCIEARSRAWQEQR
jgi:hypothetical protein